MADTEPKVARGEPLTANQAIAVLDFRATRAAKAGDYALHDDLHAAATAFDELQSQYEVLKSRFDDLQDELRSLRPMRMETIFSSPFEPRELKPVRGSRDEE